MHLSHVHHATFVRTGAGDSAEALGQLRTHNIHAPHSQLLHIVCCSVHRCLKFCRGIWLAQHPVVPLPLLSSRCHLPGMLDNEKCIRTKRVLCVMCAKEETALLCRSCLSRTYMCASVYIYIFLFCFTQGQPCQPQQPEQWPQLPRGGQRQC